MRLGLAPLLVLTSGLHQTAAHSFQRGDAVSCMRRTQYNGTRTGWAELPYSAVPRFGVDSSRSIDVMDGALVADQAGADSHKMSVALLGMQFVTPWIVLAEPGGRRLEVLELRLTASADSVTAMRWESEYAETGAEVVPTAAGFALPGRILLRVRWDFAEEQQPAAALAVVLVSCALMAAVLLVGTCSQHGAALWSATEEREVHERREERYSERWETKQD